MFNFDAFGNDHHEDAFLALSAEIHLFAKATLGGNEPTIRRYLNQAKKVGVVLSPLAARIAARASSAGLLSLEDVEAGGVSIKAAAKAIGNETAKAVEKVVSERHRKAGQDRAALEAFRSTLSELASKLATESVIEQQSFPLVFIVDELDRCRPPFALSVIERLKHLFSVPGLYFILVTHLPQLENAVQGAYGLHLDAHTYLEKFYQLRVTLPDTIERRESRLYAYAPHLSRELDLTFANNRYGELTMHVVLALGDVYDFSLRRLERVMTHVALVSASVGPHQLIVPPLAAGLCVMRQTNPFLG